MAPVGTNAGAVGLNSEIVPPAFRGMKMEKVEDLVLFLTRHPTKVCI